MITCDEAARLISDAMDAPLPAGRRWALRLHVAVCRFCRRYRSHLGILRRMIAAADPVGRDAAASPGGGGLDAGARERIALALRSELRGPPGAGGGV